MLCTTITSMAAGGWSLGGGEDGAGKVGGAGGGITHHILQILEGKESDSLV